ncbi:MAG: molybdate ABC transporter substrate-binding protein [Nevskiaceae bacterium]|nr:MAG: molybdate ABC transporter substrate-binding protein [Nevskiaceae bacterium]TBR72252.1 MAG: molybdate ABC transporter substrate-binding protein [Nevskiaceae bacterium]
MGHHEGMRRVLLVAALCCVWPAGAAPQLAPQPPVVHVAAAGSLTGALTRIADAWHAATGTDVRLRFGPAGLLRREIEAGAAVDVYVSANFTHPEKLEREGRSTAPVIVTRNHLCATTLPGFDLNAANFVDRLLDPKVGIGTSTPGADPGGDYAWQMFDKVDALRPGAGAILRAKAQQMVGSKVAPSRAPAYVVADAFSSGKVHIFIGYCSRRSVLPGTRYVRVPVPAAIAPQVDYGMAVILHDGRAPVAAWRFALYLLSSRAQAIFAQYGFEPVAALK